MGVQKKAGRLLGKIIGDNANLLLEQAKPNYSTKEGTKRIRKFLEETQKKLGDMKKELKL